MTRDRDRTRVLPVIGLLAGLAALVLFSLLTCHPDRPVPLIEPGSSPGPAFVVQVIRPRLGLPLAGLVPPRLFGLEQHLGFDAASPGASIGLVEPGRTELGATGWEMVLASDDQGVVSAETEVTFALVFEERLRQVRCRPADPAIGTVTTHSLAATKELSGRFEVELAYCEDVAAARPLGWPTKPLVLYGSFDRLPLSPTPR